MTELEFRNKMRKLREAEQQARKEQEAFSKWFVEHGDEPDPKQFDFVEECRKVYNNYLSAREKYNKGFAELKQNYIGTELERRTAEYKKFAPDADKAVTAIKAHTKIYSDHLAALEAAAMSIENITADFEFLRLPATLSTEQLQTLHARNCDNPLFCQALRQYFSEHEAEYDRGVSLDLRDSVTVRRGIVEDIAKELEKGIRVPDFDGFAQAGTELLLDVYKERLSGNGLFAQPQVVKPD